MTGSDKIALAILGAAAALGVGAVVYVKTANAALPPGAAATNVARDGQVNWTPATVLRQGDKVRISVDGNDLATLSASLGITPVDMSGWQRLLANPTIQKVIAAPSMSAWAPGDLLPTDWPADDTKAATGYHAEFVYGGVLPLDLSKAPIPMRAWVGKGVS
jgi:hypothetical protein